MALARQRAEFQSPLARLASVGWYDVGESLDSFGCATLPGMLMASECRSLSGMYADESRFRSRVVMARHGFGSGEYKYFAYPLPPWIAQLRTAIYPPLAEIANKWNGALKSDAGRTAGLRVLAVSVDPARDTQAAVHRYAIALFRISAKKISSIRSAANSVRSEVSSERTGVTESLGRTG